MKWLYLHILLVIELTVQIKMKIRLKKILGTEN